MAVEHLQVEGLYEKKLCMEYKENEEPFVTTGLLIEMLFHTIELDRKNTLFLSGGYNCGIRLYEY